MCDHWRGGKVDLKGPVAGEPYILRSYLKMTSTQVKKRNSVWLSTSRNTHEQSHSVSHITPSMGGIMTSDYLAINAFPSLLVFARKLNTRDKITSLSWTKKKTPNTLDYFPIQSYQLGLTGNSELWWKFNGKKGAALPGKRTAFAFKWSNRAKHCRWCFKMASHVIQVGFLWVKAGQT